MPLGETRYGLLRPLVDAHTLGISYLAQLIGESGHKAVIGDEVVCQAICALETSANRKILSAWLIKHRITQIGFSYRLNPDDAVEYFGKLHHVIQNENKGTLKKTPVTRVFFAGLPAASDRVWREYKGLVEVFSGDESAAETLVKLGIERTHFPPSLEAESAYDRDRMSFASDLIRSGRHLGQKPVDRTGSQNYGKAGEHVFHRLEHSRARGLPPLTRAHVGPYLPERERAVELYLDWARQLAKDGFLDVLSIGTSQLSQSHFGQAWDGKPNGGGVPLNSEDEFRRVWEAARPMLVRTYAGTSNIPALAQMYERAIHIAWHALSFWWFCQVDGRGPLPVLENLQEHFKVLRIIAASGKPFEPNIPHHFSFRGGDDVTYVLSAVLAARCAKRAGIRYFVLQNMLNTPRYTWGTQDLAKARVLLGFVRALEDDTFKVIYQPRAGLDYFSKDLSKAKVQLAAVTALMDDVEPHRNDSPDIIHVVGFSEASHLADPGVVKESIQITHTAIERYRQLRRRGDIPDMGASEEVRLRAESLESECKTGLAAMESTIPRLYTPQGLYDAFAAGFLIAPFLWSGREEFARAIKWPTRVLAGSVRTVDEKDRVLEARARMEMVKADYRSMAREKVIGSSGSY